jgi:hypothetical protein
VQDLAVPNLADAAAFASWRLRRRERIKEQLRVELIDRDLMDAFIG